MKLIRTKVPQKIGPVVLWQHYLLLSNFINFNYYFSLKLFQSKLPILRTISKFDLAKSTTQGMIDIIEPYVQSHRDSLDPENIRDFLDTMLIETENCSDPTSCFGPKIGNATIINSMMDLFIAGMETTSSSLLHLFLQLLHYPDLQEKAHREIESVSFKCCTCVPDL